LLARIAELNRLSDSHAAESETPARASYRVDSAHISAPGPLKHSPPPTKAQAAPLLQSAVVQAATAAAPADDTRRHDRVLRAAPLPIRVALETWHWVQPHQKLIRLAAMVTLMSAGGMAMFTAMNNHQPPARPFAEPAAATADTTVVPKLEIQHAEHNPENIPAPGPAAEADTLEPTATGPLPPLSKPLMATETDEPRPMLPYPTTVRPEPLEPIIAAGTLPQAQFEEEPAVARLKGTVEESHVR